MEFMAQIGYFGEPNLGPALYTVCFDGSERLAGNQYHKPKKRLTGPNELQKNRGQTFGLPLLMVGSRSQVNWEREP